jgi:hypothetical protein
VTATAATASSAKTSFWRIMAIPLRGGGSVGAGYLDRS